MRQVCCFCAKHADSKKGWTTIMCCCPACSCCSLYSPQPLASMLLPTLLNLPLSLAEGMKMLCCSRVTGHAAEP
jgi:hypothetical protein